MRLLTIKLSFRGKGGKFWIEKGTVENQDQTSADEAMEIIGNGIHV